MSEKKIKMLAIMIMDGNEIIQTYIRSELSSSQFIDKIFKLKEENEQLKQENKKLKLANLRFAQEKDDKNNIKKPLRWCE